MHLLVWLNKCKYIDYSNITVTLPHVDHDALYNIVKKHQCSDTPCLKVQNEKTLLMSNMTGFHIHCQADAFALNMRAYISSLLPALQCSMDVRCSNGEGMILKYATSYFSKWQNTFNRDSLFNRNIHATHIALQHLMTLNVCEPEMLFFSSAKIFATFMGKKNSLLHHSQSYLIKLFKTILCSRYVIYNIFKTK